MAHFWQIWTRRNPLWRSFRVGTLLMRTLYIINRERTRVVHAHQRGEYDVRPNIEALVAILREFRLTAVELGGLLIKLGQFLGTRADLLPPEALAELASLHDEVPAECFADIVQALEREWRVPASAICATIDPQPAGSASLGQVHQARLHDGRLVAVKVQRPGIEAIVRTDLRTLRLVLRIVAKVAPVANRITDLSMLYREFNRTVYAELDYVQEARNAKQFATIFADDPGILVPSIIAEYSTRRALVMEWMDGIKISEIAALDAAGVNRDRLATRLVGAYFRQVLDAGFFHADPHPGNLLVQPDDVGDRLVFVDFGMVGHVTPRMREGLRQAVAGVLGNDASRVLGGLDTLGFLSESANRDALEPIVSSLLARFGGFNMAVEAAKWQQRGEVPHEVLSDVGMALYDQPFRLPAQFAFFGRMVGMLQGVAVGLAPNFNFLEVATPFAQQFLGSAEQGRLGGMLKLFGVESMNALGPLLLQGGLATVQSLLALPQHLERILERVERGELHLVIENTHEAARYDGRTKRTRNEQQSVRRNRTAPIWAAVGFGSALGMLALTRLRPHKSIP